MHYLCCPVFKLKHCQRRGNLILKSDKYFHDLGTYSMDISLLEPRSFSLLGLFLRERP